MIRHCVFIRFKPDVPETHKEQIFDEIKALRPRLRGLMAVHVGMNVSPEAGLDKGYTEGFVVDFADASARDRYLQDAEHRKTGEKIVAAALGGIDGVFVYDIKTEEA
jgi:aminoglycoside phosphotransferase